MEKQTYGAIESDLDRPPCSPTRWRITHAEGMVKETVAQTAMEACRNLRWQMSECIHIDQVTSNP